MITNDIHGKIEIQDETTHSYTIENLEGCLNCRVTVSAKNTIGYGPKAVEEIETKSGNHRL